MRTESVPDLSFVIPVYNASRTIEAVVREIVSIGGELHTEIVLVNDGSADDSEEICRRLAEEMPDTVVFVQLARNVGEYSAVFAGLSHCHGEYVAILDDDGQHPANEALRLYDAIRAQGVDVMYGRYAVKRHGRLRNLGSRVHNQLATWMLNKPQGLYLSSFKVMNRFVVDALNDCDNAPPYIDGLIFRITQNVGEILVTHRERFAGESNYDLRQLASLWFGIFLDFSNLPLRLAGLAGFGWVVLSSLLLILIIIDKLWIGTEIAVGIPTVLCVIVFFGGVQLMIMGIFGEYLGRVLMARFASPRYVVRYASKSRVRDRHTERSS
jgi:undecaprenyl-phosphate 4-deoxy-4-formamido-L-arabinose transferase